MLPKSQAYANYWRTSLADAAYGRGAFNKTEHNTFERRSFSEFSDGLLSEEFLTRLFIDVDPKTDLVDLLVRPYTFEKTLDHARSTVSGFPQFVTPIVLKAQVNRNGEILPADLALIPRDLLEPLERSGLTIGTVETLDAWLSSNPPPDLRTPDVIKSHDVLPIPVQSDRSDAQIKWSKYAAHVEKLFNHFAGGLTTCPVPYTRHDYCLISKLRGESGASTGIMNLYDHVRVNKTQSALFDRFAQDGETPLSACLAPNSGFSIRLGHASDTYALVDAQRDAMTHHLMGEHGEMLAVNGPPGTGKTTLLLSVVASHMVQSAIAGGDPKVIIAASSNNQAVTNIIDAFAKNFSHGNGPFKGRWIPDVKSFGSYFPSSEKEKWAAGQYHTKSFFDLIESPDYIHKAKLSYLTAGQRAFDCSNPISLQNIVDALQLRLKNFSHTLHLIEQSWNSLQLETTHVTELLGSDPFAQLARLNAEAAILKSSADLASQSRLQWKNILSKQSLVDAILESWSALPRWCLARATEKAQTLGLAIPEDCQTISDVSRYFEANQTNTASALASIRHRQAQGQDALEVQTKAKVCWLAIVEPLVGNCGPDNLPSINEVDKAADTKIRFEAFLSATHYWEGRWLQSMEVLLKDTVTEKSKTGRIPVTHRWQRRMMLTPCAVFTFFMLPKAMQVKRFDSGDFVDDYLFEFIDLLIIDEAGQVLPEIAGASFLLAKQALVIGDILQLKPISHISTRIDIGNLLSNDLLQFPVVPKDFDALCHLGKTSSSGSVMRIAQSASKYQYDADLDRGMYLFEHRRCFDEIIDYCNKLSYMGKLLAKRGPIPSNKDLPAIGFLAIHGKCTQDATGSRQNLLEAETIASWIYDKRQKLEETYGATEYKTIDQIVAVVSPFAGQVAAIAAACKRLGLPVGKGDAVITIGTIHSLQGAERPVVIFSPTYSKHLDGQFIDREPNMLNVAVSRAKDSFLVFGDVDLFNSKDDGRPRGLLAKAMFAREANELLFKSLPRKDLVSNLSGPEYLVNAPQHDAFLISRLMSAKKHLRIVSPWMRLHAIRDSGILEAMRLATTRGVAVSVYSDQARNLDGDHDHWKPVADALKAINVKLFRISKLHSKIVMVDEAELCIGSFNWLSASRKDRYALHEHSLHYVGSGIAQEIVIWMEDIENKQVDG